MMRGGETMTVIAAILRAARSAQDIAIQTNTAILVSIDGKDVCLTADDIKKLREKEAKLAT